MPTVHLLIYTFKYDNSHVVGNLFTNVELDSTAYDKKKMSKDSVSSE